MKQLNDIQISLLRMFDREIPDEEVLEIKKVLVSHLSDKLLEEVDRAVNEKNISSVDYAALEVSDLRTKSEKDG